MGRSVVVALLLLLLSSSMPGLASAQLEIEASGDDGGWSSSDPAEVTSQETELGTRFVMELDPSGDVLTATIRVSDEKGEAEYRQIFRRVA
jgi:hypothetical protein